MFFYLSKVLWFFIDPGNLLFVGLILSGVLVWTRFYRLARWFVTTLAILVLFLSLLPWGQVMFNKLENRFVAPSLLPNQIEGIIVLGGVVDQFLSQERGMTAINGSVERLLEFARLAKQYPSAKLVFSGGSGVLGRQDLKEAHFVGPIFEQLGLDTNRIIFEDESRNTFENAKFSKSLATPSHNGTWLIITSAFHMPRAVGSFRKAGWRVLAYPVDFHTSSSSDISLNLNFRSRLNGLASALHEWVGLIFYWLTDRTSELFPSPNG